MANEPDLNCDDVGGGSRRTVFGVGAGVTAATMFLLKHSAQKQAAEEFKGASQTALTSFEIKGRTVTLDVDAGAPLLCLRGSARLFGWERRTPEPSSIRLADGALVGYGVACGNFRAAMSASEATLRVRAEATTRLTSTGHEMGQGILTAVADVVIQGLDINPDRLEILTGDTSMGPQVAAAGERVTAGCVPFTLRAVDALRTRFTELAGDSPPELAPERTPWPSRRVAPAVASGRTGFSSMSYIALFVEIHIDANSRRIRVPCAVGIADTSLMPTSTLSAPRAWRTGHARHRARDLLRKLPIRMDYLV